MATTIECSEQIPSYSPIEVFEVGTVVNTLPPNDMGFLIETSVERFTKDALVSIGVPIAGYDFRINSRVVEFTPAKRVLIKGSSHIGQAALWLNLSPDEESGGTNIIYGVCIQHSFLTRFAESLVEQHLGVKLPPYADRYKENIINMLDGQRSAGNKKAA